MNFIISIECFKPLKENSNSSNPTISQLIFTNEEYSAMDGHKRTIKG